MLPPPRSAPARLAAPLGIALLLGTVLALPASAEVDAPCTVSYHVTIWRVLGLPVPLVEPGAECDNLLRFEDGP
jgi:hypothetical protein